MNKLLMLVGFLTCLTIIVKAQSPPEAFNYSGAARDAQGNPISEKTIGVELSILKGSPTGGVQYRERHFVNTDKFGVFNCTVGQGSVQQGTFSAITWSNDSYYLRVGLDANGGTNFVVLGTTQLLSVPYALYAKSSTPTAINAGSNVTVTGQGTIASPYVINATGGGGNGGYTGPPIFTNGNGVTDIDGNTYKTIKLGTQEWMAENLKVTKYRNGNPIPNVTDNAQWAGLTTGAWCNYDNNASNNAVYGKLYNWYAVADSRNLCPTGWHVPSDAEWIALVKFIDPFVDTIQGESYFAGGMMKATGTLQSRNGLWQHPNTEASNASGFAGLPGGFRYDDGTFGDIGNNGYWWSSTEASTDSAWSRYLDYYDGGVGRGNGYRQAGFSVRCLRD